MSELNIQKPSTANLQHHLDKAAASYKNGAIIQREVGERLLERLPLFSIKPECVLDLGTRTGEITQALRQHYRKAHVVGIELSIPMLNFAQKQNGWFNKSSFVSSTYEQLPFANESFDVIFSNLVVHSAANFETLIKECLRVLRPNGCLMFSTLGPDTLRELRAAWHSVDQYAHVHDFIDMHNLGDQLYKYFENPVMDMEHITITYKNIHQLFEDLKNTGSSNLHPQRNRGLTTANALKKVITCYEQQFKEEGNIHPATYEVVYGHAFKPAIAPQTTQADGSVVVPIDNLLKKK